MNIRIIGKNILIDSVETFAIENDNSTELVNFIIDRYQNETDLSTLYGFIVYSNNLGVRFDILNTELVDDKIYAKWEITRALTTVNGRFDFCIVFIDSQNYNDISQESKVWSTNIAHSKISSSLVGEDYAVPNEPIILQMMKIATDVTSIERDSKQNADKAEVEADRAALAAQQAIDSISMANEIIESLIELIDEINGESVTYIESIDAINGEVI